VELATGVEHLLRGVLDVERLVLDLIDLYAPARQEDADRVPPAPGCRAPVEGR